VSDRTNDLMKDIARVCNAAARGDLEARLEDIDPDHPHAETLYAINRLLDMTDAYVRESSACLDYAHGGKYYRRVLPQGMRGSFGRAAKVINRATVSVGKETERLRVIEEQRENLIEEIASAKDVSQQLDRTTSDVEQMSHAIKKIANETNMLSLNASIEAARVGDAGRGFAVVAAEVKRLANESAEATQDIQRNVESMKSASERTVASIDHVWDVLRLQNDENDAHLGASGDTKKPPRENPEAAQTPVE